MASYFDHYLVTKIFVSFIFDSYLTLIIILLVFIIILKFNVIIQSRIQLFLEKIVIHFFEIIEENLGKISRLFVLLLLS